MTVLKDSQKKEILELVKDPKARESIESILASEYVKVVKCQSKVCRGRKVAYIDDKGKIRPITNSKGVMWLLAYRPRLDGYSGFQCICGNDSRLAKEEKGVKGIERNNVTKDDLVKVYNRVKKSQPSYPIKDGRQLIDNFSIEEI